MKLRNWTKQTQRKRFCYTDEIRRTASKETEDVFSLTQSWTDTSFSAWLSSRKHPRIKRKLSSLFLTSDINCGPKKKKNHHNHAQV